MTTTITAVPLLTESPNRSQGDTGYSATADAWAASLGVFNVGMNTSIGQLNTLGTEISAIGEGATESKNSAADSALSALESMSSALSASNYKGAWSAQTGAANIPYSVSNDSKFWMLINNLADVTASEPTNTSADWLQIGIVAELQQNIQSANYTTVASDSGRHILHPATDTTPRTLTIAANSSVPYKIGTAITFVNQASAGTLTIAITTDTMRLARQGTTGSRTLVNNGMATALKITENEWIISGTGLT